MKMIRSTVLTAIAALTLGLACGCSIPQDVSSGESAPAAQQFPNWPVLLDDLRFHWSAEPGIDVTTGAGMVTRAYLESYDTAWFTLNMENVYPGFLDATPDNQKDDDRSSAQLTHVRPLGAGITKTTADARPHYGYQIFHLLDLGDTAGAYRATVCVGEYAHFVESKSRPGKYVSIGVDDKTGQPFRPNDSGVFVYRIELEPNGGRVDRTPSSAVTAPQVGPAPAPKGDVFGTWFITGASSSGWGERTGPTAEAFPSADLQQRCESAMPIDAQQRQSMMIGYKDQPPPAGNAIPGWPD